MTEKEGELPNRGGGSVGSLTVALQGFCKKSYSHQRTSDHLKTTFIFETPDLLADALDLRRSRPLTAVVFIVQDLWLGTASVQRVDVHRVVDRVLATVLKHCLSEEVSKHIKHTTHRVVINMRLTGITAAGATVTTVVAVVATTPATRAIAVHPGKESATARRGMLQLAVE
ncbi:hypothetical protein GSI_04670 [Ganoderma sinense ZZ0214-1]|uniref:Uncharacterized protein n=1 Tax=Ganoderma sinense ZZ0214-1 TaxID=1077348 RepID=A0A2G8SHH8_9APHY|nr:hypothetical protein GSI_04670 [Ganoderma sinense ZZ0214-1]